MADIDEFYYLQPGFDPSSLTVPKLRGILVAHEIGFPSSAKKGDLVNLFESELLPNAKKILRDRDRVRRTSRGITDVPSSQEASIDDDSDARERMPPPLAPKTPRGRKSKAQLAEEATEATPRVSGRSKTPSTRRTTRTPRVSDTDHTETEQDVPRSTRPGKKSARSITPAASGRASSVRLSDVVDKHASPEGKDSPFSSDNPFQQGPSPPAEQKRAPSRSRKSAGSASVRKSTSRRRTRSPITLKHEEVEMPIAHLSTGADGVETTEEFTEDARHELQQDIADDRRIAKSRRNDVVRYQRQEPSAVARNMLSAFTFLIISIVAFWYRQEKVAVGYCGVGQPRWSLAEVENVPSWLHDSLEPQCEPCPQHAVCYHNMQVDCEHDFVLTQHPLSLNGLVPLPPTCEPDSEKEKRIKIVADRAVEELRRRRAAYECGESSTGSLTSSSTTGQEASATIVSPVKLEISEDDLKETLAKQRRKNMSPDEFEDLWSSALGDIKERDEVEITQNRQGATLLSSNSFANLPFTCAIRRSALRALAANRIPILVLILVLSFFGYGRYRFIAYRTASAQTPNLVAMTLDRLATQAALNEQGRARDSFLSVGQLRDVVLSHVIERKERERVWERVKKVVESNANVRAGTREGGKTGEWSRTWEWIGPVDFSATGLEGRKNAGLIENNSTTVVESTSGPDSKVAGDRKWDEGRAIF